MCVCVCVCVCVYVFVCVCAGFLLVYHALGSHSKLEGQKMLLCQGCWVNVNIRISHLHCLANFATLEKSRHFGNAIGTIRINTLETSPEKYQAGVWFFWNVAKFQAKLASVNGNQEMCAIFHHVTLGTSGLLATRAVWNVYRYPRPSCILHAHAACDHMLPSKKLRSFVKKLRDFVAKCKW